MRLWRALHAYTAAIDRLLLEVVGPFFEHNAAQLDHGFWERHFAGGPNLRIRLSAPPQRLDAIVAALKARSEAWLAANPMPAAPYSRSAAADLLRMEGRDPGGEDLEYRNGVVIEGAYPECGRKYVSAAARGLAEDFQRSRCDLALAVMRRPAPRHESTLRLFFALALFIGRGRYPQGSVSFKSHWEHFTATRAPDAVLERIYGDYRANRSTLLVIAEEVERSWQHDRFAGDSFLRSWWNLLHTTYESAAALLANGEGLVRRSTPEQIAVQRERILSEQSRRGSAFVKAMWADERYISGLQGDLAFQRPRALVNLLYDVVAAVGLNPLEKMALCHHAFRTVEDACQCNLNGLLRRNVEAVLSRQTTREAITDGNHSENKP